MVRSQPRQIVHKILSQKTLYTKRASIVAQGEGSEFKPQYHKKKKKKSWTPVAHAYNSSYLGG
jgi:hypothetical protein